MMSWLLGLAGVLSLAASYASDVPRAVSQPNSAVQSVPARPVGGIQLDLEPRRGQVYVDGRYMGVVGDFSGYYKHLELPAGRHLLEVFAPGYLPFELRVIIVPGRTLTYRMSLQEISSVWWW